MPDEPIETQTATMSPEDEFDAAAAEEFPEAGVEAPSQKTEEPVKEPEPEPEPETETQADEKPDATTEAEKTDEPSKSEPAKGKFGEFDTLDELVAAFDGNKNLESVIGRQGEELGRVKAERDELRDSDLALLARTNPDKAQELLDGIREKNAEERADSVARLTADPDSYINAKVDIRLAKALEEVKGNRDYNDGLKGVYGESWDTLASARTDIDNAIRNPDPSTGRPPLGWNELLQLAAIGRGVRDKTYRTGSTKEEKPLPVSGAPGGGGSQAPAKNPDSTKKQKSPEEEFDDYAEANLDPDGGIMIRG